MPRDHRGRRRAERRSTRGSGPGRTWGHTVRHLTAAARVQLLTAGWTCRHRGCPRPLTHVTEHRHQHPDQPDRTVKAWSAVCWVHARDYAAHHPGD